MTRILWVCTGEPLLSQVKALESIFGKIDITHYSVQYVTATLILQKYKSGYFDEMVLVAPLSVCKSITDFGYRPLYPLMYSTNKKNSELEMGGKYFRFQKFKRIERVELVFSEIP